MLNKKFLTFLIATPILAATFGLCTVMMKPLNGKSITQGTAPRQAPRSEHCTSKQRLSNEARDHYKQQIRDMPKEAADCRKHLETTLTGVKASTCKFLYLDKPEQTVAMYREKMAQHAAHWCGRWRGP